MCIYIKGIEKYDCSTWRIFLRIVKKLRLHLKINWQFESNSMTYKHNKILLFPQCEIHIFTLDEFSSLTSNNQRDGPKTLFQ